MAKSVTPEVINYQGKGERSEDVRLVSGYAGTITGGDPISRAMNQYKKREETDQLELPLGFMSDV